MTRPKSRRGSGFSHSKRGRSKQGPSRSHQGTRGRPPSLNQSVVGELPNGPEPPSPASTTADFTSALEGQNVSGEVPCTHEECVSEESYMDPSQNMDAVEEPTLPTIEESLTYLRGLLPKGWLPFADQIGIHNVMLSRGVDKSIQRDLFVDFNGDVRITVHRRLLTTALHEEVLQHGGAAVPLSKENLKLYVDRIVSLVLFIRSFEICAGQDYAEYECFWSSDNGGKVDSNPYDENRYVKTFRALGCQMLVPVSKWKCKECIRVGFRFRHRHSKGENYESSTPNMYLNEEQKNLKLKDQQKQIKTLKKRVASLEKRVALALQEDGVDVSQTFSDQLMDALKVEKLTPIQELFIQQQCKAASVKDKKGMRWHPTLIRFALLIKSESSAAYRAIRASGMINLPGESTLFDYSHALPKKTGVNHAKINLIAEKLAGLQEEYQMFHNLLFDEIHISNKLVYNKTTGEMIGYVHLEEVTEEMTYLVSKVTTGKGEEEPATATKMLAYMVKGVANNVKEIVGFFPTKAITKEQLYDFTWEVISALEIAGIKVLSVVCDGASINRGFFDLHKPVTVTKSGVVFDTVNLCAPDRILYFISDVPHLLKCIRNAFAKSGRHKKCKRKLTKCGQLILWSTIERLYLEDHECVWRQSHKLNAMNVYLNSYSCMRVPYAAQVMSNTVAQDLKIRNWPGTSETVEFLLKVNDFFDCLNGAHSEQGKRKQNPLLNPYRSCDDERFEKLLGFLDYLNDWKGEVDALPGLKAEERAKLFLPRETLEGIEISIRAISDAIKFMIKIGNGKVFINARVFCQDPLEQYFSKQRGRLGGSRNPNVEQFMQTDNMISVHRDLNVRKRSGNTEAHATHMEITSEPLPKRKKVS